MVERQHFGWKTLLCLMLVLVAAAGARGWYLIACVENGYGPTPLAVQDAPRPVPQMSDADYLFHKQPNELDELAQNIRKEQWFGTRAPLADKEELTAHRAPAYPWLLAQLARTIPEGDRALYLLRWAQAFLGVLTAGLYFLFAWLAFRSLTVALLAGLFCAVHPFWVINVAEVDDGTLTGFVLALAVLLGSLAGGRGGALSSLLFGLTLAGLALVRAALLPFALVGCLWFLLRCRTLPRGWLYGLVAVLGLANGLVPWLLRNYQAFHDVIPVSNATYLHLWIGNNELATGGPQSEESMRKALGPDYLSDYLEEKDQTKRYRMLAEEVANDLQNKPERAVRLRVRALLYFVFGENWFKAGDLCRIEYTGSLPKLIRHDYPLILQSTLLALLLLHLLGWRWTYGWRRQTRLATLALIWVPLPYVLGHAETLSGPRLPLDGVMLCYAAFAVCCLLPGVGRRLFRGPLN